MRRMIRIMLARVTLTLVTAPAAVHPTTTSKAVDVLGVPHVTVFTLTAKPRQPLLRPAEGPLYLVAKATLPCRRFIACSMSAGHRVLVARPALLRWHTHLPRSQAGEPPSSPPPPILA